MKQSIVWVLMLGLMGCRANDDSLTQFIQDAHQTARAKVEPLPQVDDFVADDFVMTRDRVPFLRPLPEHQESGDGGNKACWQPNLARIKTPLETFPLEQLAMKGVLGDGSQLWALIYTPEGKLMKVTTDSYMGLNHGRIIEVTSRKVSVEEILPDGTGCWIKRTVPLMLAQQ
ncbi:TPA: pilus assembly protein PilP [Photobacterium damselae]